MFSLSVRSGVRPQLPKKCWKGVIFSNLGQCLWGGRGGGRGGGEGGDEGGRGKEEREEKEVGGKGEDGL